MTVTDKPTTAQHRFLTAIADDGGVSTRAMTLVGSWRPILISRDNGWVVEEPRPDGHPGQIQHRLLAAGYRAIDRDVPAPGTPEGDALLTDEERVAAGWLVDQDEVDQLLDDAVGPPSAVTPSVFPDAPPVHSYADGSQEFGPYAPAPVHPVSRLAGGGLLMVENDPELSRPEPAPTARDADGREYGSDATVEVTADGDPMRGRQATVTVTGLQTGGDATVLLRFEGMSTPVIRYADEVRVIDQEAEPAGLPSGYNDDPVEAGVDEAALWTPDPLPVPATAPRRVEPAPTSVQIDGRRVVFADASLVELVTVCRDESARAQHLDPHEGRRYFRARAASDAALDEIKRRVDTLHRAAAAAGPGNGLHDVLAVLDAADRRPVAEPATS